MEISERVKKYAAIEAYRKRPLLVYATSTRVGIQASMASDAIREFIDQIDRMKPEEKCVDVLIHSSGGDALTAWKLMSILRERFSNIAVLVPFSAFSAATIFALGADKIVMHPHASLGPIDPQITTQTSDGKAIQFAYEDLGAFLRFLRLEAKISNQENLSAVIERLFTTIDPIKVGASLRASELSTAIGERLLKTHMNGFLEKRSAKRIAENLNRSFFAHGDAVSRLRAIELGLRIAKTDQELEALIWDSYLGIEEYMEIRKPFDFVQAFLATPEGAAAMAPTAPLKLPPDLPQPLVAQIYQQVATKAVSNQPVEVGFNWRCAIIESCRLASEVLATGKFSVNRQPNGQFAVAAITSSSSWKNVPI